MGSILTINRNISEQTLFADRCWYHWMPVHKCDALSNKVLCTADSSYQIKIAEIISAPSTALGAGKGSKVEVERNICGVKKFRIFGGWEKRRKDLYKRSTNCWKKRTHLIQAWSICSFVRICQSIHTMLCATHHQYNSVKVLTWKHLCHRHQYPLQPASLIRIHDRVSRLVRT